MTAEVETVVQIKFPAWETAVPAVEALCHQAAEAAWLIALKRAGKFEASVVLADDGFVQALNRDYRHQDKPTNVLSFPGTDENEAIPDNVDDVPSLGDIVIAFETTRNEAPNDLANHLSHLVVHGCLHLLGYDHIDANEAEAMEALESEILASLGIANPYVEITNG